MHYSYMIVISALFAVVFAIMIYSMIRHRQACARSEAGFTGTTGTAQWFWALVPLAILAFINFSLIGVSDDHASTLSAPNKKIKLATVQTVPYGTPLGAAGRGVDTARLPDDGHDQP